MKLAEKSSDELSNGASFAELHEHVQKSFSEAELANINERIAKKKKRNEAKQARKAEQAKPVEHA